MNGVPLPRFIGPDFRVGGQLVGSEIVRQAALDPPHGIVVLEGPSVPAPNEIRAAWALHEILSAGLDVPVIVERLDRLDERCGVAGFGEAINRLDKRVGRRATNVIVSSGTDKVGIALAAFVDGGTEPLVLDRHI